MSEVTRSDPLSAGAGRPDPRASARPLTPATGTAARRAWRGPYVRSLVLGDVACGIAAAGVGLLSRFGPTEAGNAPASLAIAALLPVVWVFAMLVARTYEDQFLREGPEEFRRVLLAAALLLAIIATASWGLTLEVARGFVAIAVLLATALTLVERQAQRWWLRREWSRGRLLQTTLLVGHRNGVASLQAQLQREPHHGYRLIGCCLPPGPDPDDEFSGLPVLGRPQDVVEVVGRYGVDAVAVLPSPEMDGAALRRLGWELESTRADLLLAPSVSEVAGPRISVRPVRGLSLLQMERPELHGVPRVIKEVFDRTCAALLLLLTMPVLLAAALAVKVTSRGPVLCRQDRAGKDGRTFAMLTLRCTEREADQQAGASSRVRGEPGVTRVGAILRRYSLDELPQLFNVLTGAMSMVGPRPPLPAEVEQSGGELTRRMVVKPGLTGLWHVSGRSDLSWDDSVRLDVHYIANWSLLLDLMILWRTVTGVLRGHGAR